MQKWVKENFLNKKKVSENKLRPTEKLLTATVGGKIVNTLKRKARIGAFV